jgi:hypothetical protein
MSSAEPILHTYNHPTAGPIRFLQIPESVTYWPSLEEMQRTVEYAEALAELLGMWPQEVRVNNADDAGELRPVKGGIMRRVSELSHLLNPYKDTLEKAPLSWGFRGWPDCVEVYYVRLHRAFKEVVRHFGFQPLYERRPGATDPGIGRPADSLINRLAELARQIKERLSTVAVPDAFEGDLVNIMSLEDVWKKVIPSYKRLKRLLGETKKVRTRSEKRRFLVHREEFLRWVDDVKALQRKTGDKAADVSDEALDAASAEIRWMEQEKEKIKRDNLDRKRAQG